MEKLKDRQGVNEALIENAQDDVDRNQSRTDEIGSSDKDCWNACAVPWKEPVKV